MGCDSQLHFHTTDLERQHTRKLLRHGEKNLSQRGPARIECREFPSKPSRRISESGVQNRGIYFLSTILIQNKSKYFKVRPLVGPPSQQKRPEFPGFFIFISPKFFNRSFESF
jgi:hypothetical protein